MMKNYYKKHKKWKKIRIKTVEKEGRRKITYYWRINLFFSGVTKKVQGYGCGRSTDRKNYIHVCGGQPCKHVIAAYIFHCKDYQ